MANWLDISVENEEAAKELLGARRWRSAVSRAYYAAYAFTTACLKAQGLAFVSHRDNPSHAALPQLIEGNIAGLKAWQRRDLKSITRRMYAARCAADYRETASVGMVEARQSLTDLSTVRRMLSSKEVP